MTPSYDACVVYNARSQNKLVRRPTMYRRLLQPVGHFYYCKVQIVL